MVKINIKKDKRIIQDGVTKYKCARCGFYHEEDKMRTNKVYCKVCSNHIDKLNRIAKDKNNNIIRSRSNAGRKRNPDKIKMINGSIHYKCSRCGEYHQDWNMDSYKLYCSSCRSNVNRVSREKAKFKKLQNIAE